MSKYEALGQFLERLDAEHWRPTFHELERLIGDELPASARKREAWWSNDATGSQRQAHAWMDAGWSVEKVDFDKGVVSFARKAAAALADAKGARAPGAAVRLADEVQARAEGVAKVARQWGSEGADRAASIVRKRPATTVGVGAGVAFAAGLAIGFLLFSSRRSPPVVEIVEERGADLFGLLRGRLGGFPERAAGLAQSRADDALSQLKRGLERLPLPSAAAEAARDRADDAIRSLRQGLRDLQAAAMERLGH